MVFIQKHLLDYNARQELCKLFFILFFLLRGLIGFICNITKFLWNESKFVEYRFIGHWMLIGTLVELWITIQRLIYIKYGLHIFRFTSSC